MALPEHLTIRASLPGETVEVELPDEDGDIFIRLTEALPGDDVIIAETFLSADAALALSKYLKKAAKLAAKESRA